jgi:hypothetical protein
MPQIDYFPANRTAGYSGFVFYSVAMGDSYNVSYWMIPGTFFDDWDN